MVKSIVNNLFSWQFIKYIIVGFVGTALDFSFLYLLVEYGHLFYLLAAVISVSLVLWVSFTLNKYWTFKNFEKKYCLSHLIALVVSLVILASLVQFFHLWYLLAKVFATIAAAIVNFLLVRNFIFSVDKGKIPTVAIGGDN